jgi:hypothetical protein
MLARYFIDHFRHGSRTCQQVTEQAICNFKQFPDSRSIVVSSKDQLSVSRSDLTESG